MRVGVLVVVVSLLARPLLAGVEVGLEDGHVRLTAERAPLAAVLDALAQSTGMKVVYESDRPSQVISTTLEGVTPAEAVLAVLEGQNLNYALVLDLAGTQVQTLLLTGTAPVRSSRATTPANQRRPRPRRPVPRPRPRDPADAEEEDVPEEDLEGQEQPEDVIGPGRSFQRSPFAPGPTAPGGVAPSAETGATPGSPLPFGLPDQQFSVSPFAPRATPRATPAPPPTPGEPIEQ